MKKNTNTYSTKTKSLPLVLLLIPIMITIFSFLSSIDKDYKVKKAYVKTFNKNCSNNENSYFCYHTKFNQPIVSSHRNRYAIKKQRKRRDLLKNYKITFDSCLEEYKNTSNLNLNKCHTSLILFQDDIKNKSIEKKLIKYQEENIKYPLAYFRHELFEVHIKKLGRR